MFSLFHFSRVFPYIHPYLFPMESGKPAGPAADTRLNASSEQAAATCAPSPAQAPAAPARAGLAGKRLRLLHRRHARTQLNESLTHSSLLRRPAW